MRGIRKKMTEPKKFDIRGVVEGFYGKPWTMEARVKLMTFLGEKSYNLYIYAPKDDFLHRFRWREAYPVSFMENFAILVAEGKKNGVDVSFAVSPGLSLVYSDPVELEILIEKFLSFGKLGVRAFSLFLDDIPGRLQHKADMDKFKSLAEAQIFFINKLFTALENEFSNIELILCPTEYRGKGESDYLKELGDGLNKNIQIMWTGPQVCSETIPEEDAVRMNEVFKRPVLYWDNFPVNDVSMMAELHIGPYIGRDKNLVKHSSGIVLNPMNQIYASKIAFAEVSEYLNDPKSYNAQEAWKRAITEMGGEAASELLHFAKFNTKSPLCPGESETAIKIAKEFSYLYDSDKTDEAILYLSEEASKIINGAIRLEKLLAKDFLDDISPWLHEYREWGEILKTVSELYRSNNAVYMNGTTVEEIDLAKHLLMKLENQLIKLVSQDTVICGNSFRNLATEAITKLKAFILLKEQFVKSHNIQ